MEDWRNILMNSWVIGEVIHALGFMSCEVPSWLSDVSPSSLTPLVLCPQSVLSFGTRRPPRDPCEELSKRLAARPSMIPGPPV